MKRIAILVILLAPALAVAQSYRPLETTDEARQRHNAERYDTYRQRGNQAPLGGYQDRLGDPAPRGTESPGMVRPSRDPYGSGQDRDRRGYR